MKFFTHCLSAVLLLADATSEARRLGAVRKLKKPHPNAKKIDGEYIVTLQGPSDSTSLYAMLTSEYNALIPHEYSVPGFTGFSITGCTDEVVEALENSTMVGSIDHNVELEYSDYYDPPLTQTEVLNIGLDRIDQESSTLDNTYTYRFTGSSVTAFILDSGLRTTHSEFEGRASCGFDATLDTFYNESDIPCFENKGHGTHVAGTIGGKTVGVAKEVTLVGVKIGTKTFVSASAVIAGLNYVAQEKLDHPEQPMVACMSIGGNPYPAIDTAAQAVIDAGVPLILSAGNNGMDACDRSPQGIDEAITVGVSMRDDTVPFWSNYGNCVDIYSPGDAIYSAWKKNDTDLRYATGSSFSAPFVAGAAVLKLDENPEYLPAKVWNKIKKDALKNVLQDVIGPSSTNRLVHIPY